MLSYRGLHILNADTYCSYKKGGLLLVLFSGSVVSDSLQPHGL